MDFICPECKCDKIEVVRVKAGMFVNTYYLRCTKCKHEFEERG